MTDVRQIPLTRGKVALVDAADFERVAALEWFAVCSNGRWYAAHDEWKPRRHLLLHRFKWTPRHQLLLHRFILGTPQGAQVGFVNGDSLDCRRTNLSSRKGAGYYVRVPQAEPYPRESLPVVEAKVVARRLYVGVVDTGNGKFGARIRNRGEYPWLGTYATERDAALAVNVAARLLRGHHSGAVNDVPPAVPLDEFERAARALAGEPEVKQSKRRSARAAPSWPGHTDQEILSTMHPQSTTKEPHR